MKKNNYYNSRKPIASINVVPYIDVMLVLLIIFMVATPLMIQGVQVNLPKVSANEISIKSQEPVVITIDKEGKIFLNIDNDGTVALTKNQMMTSIENHLIKNQKSSFLIKADENSSHGDVIKVMGWLQQIDIRQIGIITK